MSNNDNPTSASTTASALGAVAIELTVEQIKAQFQQAITAARERDQKKEEEHRAQVLQKINEVPAFVGVSSLTEVFGLIRDVLRESKPASIVPVVRPGAARTDREKAVLAVKNGATQKQIEETFDYSVAWFYKTRKALGMAKEYAPTKRKAKGRFPART